MSALTDYLDYVLLALIVVNLGFVGFNMHSAKRLYEMTALYSRLLAARKYKVANWTQPICGVCWDEKNPDRPPVKSSAIELKHCAFCGRDTLEGIYMRVDPNTVKFPDAG